LQSFVDEHEQAKFILDRHTFKQFSKGQCLMKSC